MALSARTPINCAITGGVHTLKSLTLIHLNCNDSFYCENNINFIGDKRCYTLKPYILKTINADIVPIVESVRPLNVSLPKVYPFSSDKNLVLTLEEQMKVQDRNIRETEKTGNSLSKQGNVGSTKSLVMTLAAALSILLIVLIFLTLYTIYRYRRDLNIHTASIVKIGNTMSHPTKSIAQPNLDK